MNKALFEELHKQIIAIQLIQELIVDMCDEKGLFTRKDFESKLQERVVKLNEEITKLNDQMDKSETEKPVSFHNIIPPIIGEA